LITAGDDYGLV